MPGLSPVLLFSWRLIERWGFDQCSLIAAAMAFFALLSLFPIILAAITIIGKMLAGNQHVLQGFLRFVESYFPGTSGAIYEERVEEAIRSIDSSAHLTLIGAVSFASLLWSGRGFFDTLASVLNSIWPHSQPRSWLGHQAALWATVLGVGVLWLISTSATVALSAAQAFSAQFPDLFINRQPFLWNGLARLISWLLTLLMFWMIYRFLPNVEQGGRGMNAFRAALVASVSWELAKWGFARYLPNAARYGAVYGSFAGVVLTMMWLYVSSSIILLGAEAAAAYAETRAALRGEKKPTLDSAGELARTAARSPDELNLPAAEEHA